jgi:hypothetical protein
MAVSEQQKIANKARRLRNAAETNDGITIHFLQTLQFVATAGETVVVMPSAARRYIAEGVAELAE